MKASSPLVVSAFHQTLLHQLLLLLAIGVGLALAWNLAYTLQQRRAAARGVSGVGDAGGAIVAAPVAPEPPGRRLVRISFGVLWIVDGLLQVQSAMPLGMPKDVVHPAAAGSPSWVHHIVAAGMTIWTHHPVQAAASVVWIQVGLGVALLLVPRGRWSRLAGVAALAWALVVWVFGEAFGGVFSPGQQWAFGLPGAVLLYAVAGVLVALPEGAWRGARLGRSVLRAAGLFLVGMSVLQAWPSSGNWRGTGRAPLAAMVRTMARTPQPHWLSSWLASFASLDAAHGWGVNLFLVLALALVGLALCAGRGRLLVTGIVAAGTLCLAAWVLVQDLGFLGGVGTDPNSMVPTVLLLVVGLVATRRAPAVTNEPVLVSWAGIVTGRGADGSAAGGVEPGSRRGWEVLSPRFLARVAGGLLSAAIVLVGVVPMASASLNPNATTLVTETVKGAPSAVREPLHRSGFDDRAATTGSPGRRAQGW